MLAEPRAAGLRVAEDQHQVAVYARLQNPTEFVEFLLVILHDDDDLAHVRTVARLLGQFLAIASPLLLVHECLPGADSLEKLLLEERHFKSDTADVLLFSPPRQL